MNTKMDNVSCVPRCYHKTVISVAETVRGNLKGSLRGNDAMFKRLITRRANKACPSYSSNSGVKEE